MPSRRPYASRGVPRRMTTLRSGGFRARALSLTLGTAAVVLALASIIWLVNPFASIAAAITGRSTGGLQAAGGLSSAQSAASTNQRTSHADLGQSADPAAAALPVDGT